MEYTQSLIVMNDIELKLCIDRTLSQDKQLIKDLLYAGCNHIKNKYQSDLSLSDQQFGTELFETFSKINQYSEIIQNLLESYVPCQKLGDILKVINQCLSELFCFAKTHLAQKKNYDLDYLKRLEEKNKSQASGLCNRCSKFVLRSDVQQAKILITAGQFDDPFNLYDLGQGEYSVSRRKQQQSQYRVRYIQAWQNKKKIQQKIYSLELQNDRRSYGCANQINQIQKMEEQIKGILLNIKKQPNDVQSLKNQKFKENLLKLIQAVYEKIKKIDQSLLKKDEGIQVGQFQKPKQIEDLKKELEKEIKKNHFLNKQLIIKQRQVYDQNSRNSRLTEDFKKCLIEKSAFETKIKSLLENQYQSDSQIAVLANENKNNIKKIEELQRQLERIILELNKKSANMSTKNAKSIKFVSNGMKSLKIIRIENNETDKNRKDWERSKKLVSVQIFDEQNQQLTSTGRNQKGVNSIEQLVESSKQKNKQFMNFHDQVNQEYSVSKKSFKKLASIREQNSRLNIRDSAQNERQHSFNSEVSIELKKTEKKLQIIREKSSRRVQSKMKSKQNQKYKKDFESGKQIKLMLNNSLQRQLSKTNGEQNKQINDDQMLIQKPVKQIVQEDRKEKLNSILKRKLSNQNIQTKLRLAKPSKKINSVHTASKNESANVMIQKQNESKFKKQKSLHFSSSSEMKSNFKTVSQFDVIKKNKKSNNSILNSTLPILNCNQQCEKMESQPQNYERTFMNLFKHYQSLLEASIAENRQQLSSTAESLKIKLSNTATFLIFKEKIERYLRQCVNEHLAQILTKIQSMEQVVDQRDSTFLIQKRRSTIKNHFSQTFEQGERQSVIIHKVPKFDSSFSNSFYGTDKKGTQNLETKKIVKYNHRLLNSEKNTQFHWSRNSNKNKVSQFNISQTLSALPENINYIKQRMSILYFSAEQAYMVEKQESMQIQKEKGIAQKALPSINFRKTFSQFGEQQICLLKPQIKYLKLISIILAKLHDKNVKVYQVVKKAVLFPYSYLINGLECATPNNLNQNIEERKTVGVSFKPAHSYEENNEYNFQNRLLSNSLVKLIILHRKCITKNSLSIDQNQNTLKSSQLSAVQSRNSQSLVKPQKQNISKALKRLSKQLKSKKWEQKSQSECVCKHLLEFQKQVQYQFKTLNGALEQIQENIAQGKREVATKV